MNCRSALDSTGVVDVARDERDRRRALRQTKRLATGLLVAAFGVFLIVSALEPTTPGPGTLLRLRGGVDGRRGGGLVRGDLLFRHPLRIPIPHTAIIPACKDDLGRGPGAFVESNFLTPSS